MKILEMNSVCGIKSTGRIVSDLYHMFVDRGHQCKVAYGRENPMRVPEQDVYRIGNDMDVRAHALMSRITDKSGLYSRGATRRFIAWVREYNPDLIHIHNIHGYYIDIQQLFEYIREENKQVIWTLHDCWAFTGHCAYFDFCNCDRWRSGCYDCPQKSAYPASLFLDNSRKNYESKKNLFQNLDMQIVTPSDWLNRVVKQSFLGDYQVTTINNGIDLEQFSPRKSEFRTKYKLEDEKIILGVASVWDQRKGLRDFIRLAEKLEDCYKVVLVGLSQEQQGSLPDNVIAISRTDSVEELAEIYSVADVFVNPTYEDNFPTTNIEALACGTPVITYDTGGSPEIIDNTCGIVVDKGDVDGLVKQIPIACELTSDACIQRSKRFDRNENYLEYLELTNKRG